jgi:hypothetical protein
LCIEKDMLDAQKNIKPRPPIHYVGCVLTIIFDWLWFLVELTESFSIERLSAIFTIIVGAFITCFIAVTLIQRFMAHDGWKNSITKGLVMGIAAGVPYPVVGTFVGVVLIATARIYWRAPREEEPSE